MPNATHTLVLLRHGESDWNKENRFTGWTDVDLSDKGRQEAHEAGVVLKAEGYAFDVAYTTVLKRAIRTLWMTLDELRDSQARHRTPLVLRCVEDYLDGRRFPLDLVYTDSVAPAS